MPVVIEYSGTPDIAETGEYFLNTLLTIYPAPSSATARRLRARLYVGGVEKPIKSASWSVSANQQTGDLQVELANVADRSAFTRTATIKFEVEEDPGSGFAVVKTYCDGAILATSAYDIQNDGDKPNDKFSITVKSVLQQKLDLTPEQTVVLYDPEKVTVSASQIEAITNIDGTDAGSPTVTSVADMNLGDVFEFIADTYGLAGYKTNINYEPWKLARVDFTAAQPYWNTVAGIIGNHEPRVSIDADDYLVIADGTLSDYVSARQMTLGQFKSVTLNKQIERFKGCHLTYQTQLTADNWDFSRLRSERKTLWFEGVAGQYPMTEEIRWYQDFYQNAFDSVPIATQEFAVRQIEYESASEIVSANAEQSSYRFSDSGRTVRLTRTESKEWSWANVPQEWADYSAGLPGPLTDFAGSFSGPESSFTVAGFTGTTEAFVLTKAKRKTYTYSPMYDRGDVSYVTQTDEEERGLVMKDTENQQLGNDFEQPWNRAQENGNLAEGQDAYWGTTDKRREMQTAEKQRNVSLRTRNHTPLNSSKGLITENYHDRRKGDVGDSDIQSEALHTYIREGGDSTASLWRQVNGGEAPLVILQPLCHRLNRSQDYPGGITAPLPTYDETMQIGQVIDPRVDGRANVSLGIFEVIGYSDSFASVDDGGFKTSVTARQIA